MTRCPEGHDLHPIGSDGTCPEAQLNCLLIIINIIHFLLRGFLFYEREAVPWLALHLRL